MPAGPAPVGKVLRYKPKESMGVWEYGSMGVWEYGSMGVWEYVPFTRLVHFG